MYNTDLAGAAASACSPMPPGFYNMDCIEAMKKFPNKFFDLAIVDPPYGGGSICSKDDTPTRKNFGRRRGQLAAQKARTIRGNI